MTQPMRWNADLACGCEASGEADKSKLPKPGDQWWCTAHVQTTILRVMARSK